MESTGEINFLNVQGDFDRLEAEARAESRPLAVHLGIEKGAVQTARIGRSQLMGRAVAQGFQTSYTVARTVIRSFGMMIYFRSAEYRASVSQSWKNSWKQIKESGFLGYCVLRPSKWVEKKSSLQLRLNTATFLCGMAFEQPRNSEQRWAIAQIFGCQKIMRKVQKVGSSLLEQCRKLKQRVKMLETQNSYLQKMLACYDKVLRHLGLRGNA